MRYNFLLKVIQKYAERNDLILDVGCGNLEAVNLLIKNGFLATGLDLKYGRGIEEVVSFDVIYTMSTLFLIKEEGVIKGLAAAARKYIITIEGEESRPGIGVIGRDYSNVFEPLGFKQIEHQENVFNEFGHLRVFKKI